MIIKRKHLINRYFDIFDNIVIIDIPVQDEWWVLYYINHKLASKETWKF